jgi:hypothetical protein
MKLSAEAKLGFFVFAVALAFAFLVVTLVKYHYLSRKQRNT